MSEKKKSHDEKEQKSAPKDAEEEQVEQKELTPEEKITELTDLLKRKQAEFTNYQQRMEQQNVDRAKFAGIRVIEKLLPIVDMFDMAVAHKDKKDDFIAGMEMVHAQLHEVLANENITIESQLDKPYDPAKAQAVSTVVDESKDDNTVVQEIQKCYLAGDRVIRHAKVIVSKKASDEENKTEDSK